MSFILFKIEDYVKQVILGTQNLMNRLFTKITFFEDIYWPILYPIQHQTGQN